MAEQVDWINRLGKWRIVFAGWQLGTRAKDDPECNAVRDHRDCTMMLRAEVTAFVGLMIDKGVFTSDEFAQRLQSECKYLCDLYETKFPGFHATDDGMQINTAKAYETTKDWKP